MNNSLETLKNNRKGILFIELAGLLHDIGKLSEEFLEYRKTWQDDPQGWGKDPHSERKWRDQEANRDIEERYLDDIEKFKVPDEFKKEIKGVTDCDFGEPDFSIQKAVHDHHKDGTKIVLGPLIKMLQAADGKDSAIDRNNPLFSAEQKNNIYKSNVFGFEQDRKIEYKSQEDARKKLYTDLGVELPTYFNSFDNDFRCRILDNIKNALDQGISDTTRPQNDTSLWEHAYGVASILKVLSVHNLFNKGNEIYEIKDVRFGIFGVGWDGFKFISYGQKIGDIVGRKNVLDNIKKSIKEIVESKYPVGNTIYEDDNGIYFIVPAGFDESDLNKAQYPDIRYAILKKTYEMAAEKSAGELQPHVVDISKTNTLTAIVRAIKMMREKTSYPFDSAVQGFKYFAKYLQKFEAKKTVCPICRLRAVEKEDVDKKICKECRKCRTEAVIRESDSADQQTVFIDEIVDENQGAALIVARFGLRNWLDGTMIRTLFVSEENGIKKEIDSLGKIKAFQVGIEKDLRKHFKTTEYSYNRIKKDIDSFNPDHANFDKKRATKIAFLYAYRYRGNKEHDYKVNVTNIWEQWEDILKDLKEEIGNSSKEDILLYNVLNLKTPTPSTILDVWFTTLHFFKTEVSGLFRNELKEDFPQVNRSQIRTKEDISPWNGTLEAEIISKIGTKKRVEILFKGKRFLEVIGEQYQEDNNTGDLSRVNIIDKNYPTYSKEDNRIFTVEKLIPGNLFMRYRIITESPNIYMAIVPANKALKVTNSIHKKYKERFGKVVGRLPLSIGNIFFRKKMPMFVVLDAGKKMLNNFEKLANNKEKMLFDVITRKDANDKSSLNIGAVLETENEAYKRTVQWDLPSKLGNKDEDYYHPYFFVDSKNKNISSRQTFFKTIPGDVIHFTEIEEGDTLCVRPNFYDFEFLDSNIRRHDIQIDNDLRRKSNIANFRSKPFLLDEVDQKVIEIWEHLIQGKRLQGITDAKLRNLQSLWLTKYQEWSVNLDEPDTDSCKVWNKFVETSVKKEFPDIDKQDEVRSVLLETIKNGVFFDMLELYLGILKMRVKDVQKKEIKP